MVKRIAVLFVVVVAGGAAFLCGRPALGEMSDKEWADKKKEYATLAKATDEATLKKAVDILVAADREESEKMLVEFIEHPTADCTQQIEKLNKEGMKAPPSNLDSPEEAAKKDNALKERVRKITELNNEIMVRERTRDYAAAGLSKLRKEWADKKKEYATLAKATDENSLKKAIDILVARDREESAKMLVEFIKQPTADYTQQIEKLNKEGMKAPASNLDSPEELAKKEKALQERVRKITEFNNEIMVRERTRDYAGAGLGKLRSDGAMKFLTEKALKEKSEAVQRGAITAMGNFQDVKYVEPLAKHLKAAKGSPEVRMAVCDALGAMANEAAAAPLTEVVDKDEVWQVRMTAADALIKLKAYKAIKPMIDRLHRETGRVKIDWEEKMRDLVGVHFAGRDELWDKWWETNKEKIEKGEFVAAASGKIEAQDERRSAATFFGIPVESDNCIFVLDVSGSMRELMMTQVGGPEVTSKDGAKEDPVPEVTGNTRLDEAKRQMIRILRKLPERARFNVIVYATDVEVLSPAMLAAAKPNVEMMVAKILKLEPRDQTNIFDAFERAFNMAGAGTGDANYRNSVDTIYFMTDGDPNYGRVIDLQQILLEIARMNRHRRIRIHCVEINPHPNGLMERIANDNGGSYVNKR
ncbi:MAG: HEAT repeat domain-containing protein [Planctomycetes bacterium]|nr:HEAT repeat domain-containing protein [Planctomycetota bacterium]